MTLFSGQPAQAGTKTVTPIKILMTQETMGLVGWLEFNIPFQHKYSYIRNDKSGVESYPLIQ